jgi:DnaJ-class molecular chaperone
MKPCGTCKGEGVLVERQGFFKLEVECPKCFGKKKERKKTETEELKEKLLR